MSRDKSERVPLRRPSQACLPFSGVRDDDCGVIGPAVVKDPEACPVLEDPDADLDAMSDEDLRQVIFELKASRDQRSDRVFRRLKAILLLRGRGARATSRKVRSDQGSTLAATTTRRAARRPRRPRFVTVLDRVNREGGPKPVDDLARRLADDLHDQESIRTFRRIAEGVRAGELSPQIVEEAYKAARKPGVDRPGALFTWYVLDRSHGLARARVVRR
jgi:hypothetical protein